MGRECWCRRSVGAAVPAAGLTASDVGNQHFARHHDAVQACARRFPLTRFPPRRTLVASPTHGGYDMLNIRIDGRSEEHTSELQSLMRISYAVFCLKKKNINYPH